MKRFIKFAPFLAVAMVLGSSNLFCPVLTELTSSEQATLTANVCGPFKVIAADGFPNGPAAISWTRPAISLSAGEGYGHFYQIDVYTVPLDPKQPSVSLAHVFVKDPLTTAKVALKSSPSTKLASYLVIINEGYANNQYPTHEDDPYLAWFSDCTINYTVKLTPPQPRILPSPTPMPTAKPPVVKPPSAPQPPPATQLPQAPQPPPANTPIPAVPTACPSGQNGDPASGIPCMKIPG